MNGNDKLSELNRLIKHCKNSIFYNEKLPKYPLKSMEEIKQIPLTTKEDIRNHSPYGLICVSQKELYQYHESFGTTGIPASTWLTQDDFSDLIHSVNSKGVNFTPEDTVLIRFPYAISSVAHFVHAAAQDKGACIIPVSSRSSVSPFIRVVNLMRKLNVTVLACLPLQAVLIAETAEMLGFKPDTDFPSLRAIYTAGEALTPYKRKLIESIWGTDVYDNYGMTEIGAFAVSCENKHLHPFEDKFIYEVLDDTMKNDVGSGEIGNLVVTTLTKRAAPLIRYVTGDQVKILEYDCPCGNSKILQVRGRKRDAITVNGQAFDLWDIGSIVSELFLKRFWVAGPSNDSIKIVFEEDGNSENMIEEQRIKDLKQKYGVKIDLEGVPKGTLYDRKELMYEGYAGKPVYIYNEDRINKKDYSLKCTN